MKTKDLMKRVTAHGARLLLVALLAMISVNAWANTIYLPGGSSTYTRGTWQDAGAPSSYNAASTEENINIGNNQYLPITFYHAADLGTTFPTTGWLQLKGSSKSDNGYISLHVTSTATITVTVSYCCTEDATLQLGNSSYTFSNGKGSDPSASGAFSTITQTGTSDLELTITAGTSVAYIGTITLTSSGTITAYASCTERNITMADFSKDYGVADFTPTHTVSAGSGTKTWTSSNTSVATIVSNKVHIVGAGITTIGLTVAGDGTYCETTKSCTMTVNAVAPTVTNFTATCTNNTISISNPNASSVSDKGGANITRYGYIYSTTKSTTSELVFGASGVTDANVGTDNINLNTRFAAKSITGLTGGTTYYVRAYAYNGTARGYSSIVTITTKCAVTYVANNGGAGGSTTDASSPYAKNSNVTVLENGFTAPAGKTFHHWNGSDGNSYYPGNTINSLATDITLTAYWADVTYTDYQFSCAELTLTPVLATAGTPIFITSTSGKTVRSQDKITIVGSGLSKNQALEFPNLPSQFQIKTASFGEIKTSAADGSINVDAYIFYTPGSESTDLVDGIDKITGITVKVGGNKPIQKTLTQDIIGRHLPSQFVIATKFGGSWYALPADYDKTHSESGCNKGAVAISVDVDGSGNPTHAYGPSTVVYGLNMVGGGGTGTSRFQSNGQYVYFDMLNNSHYPLAAAASGTAVARGTGNASTGNLDENNMWKLTQRTASISNATEATYHFNNGQNTKYALKLYHTDDLWGLYSYKNGVDSILRLIPWSAVEPLELSVLEWGETSVAVKSAAVNLSTGYTVTARLGSGEAVTVSSITKDGDDLYILRGVGTLTISSGSGAKSLTITATPASGTAKQAVLQVPLIISNDNATKPSEYVSYTEKQISSFAAGGTGADKVTEGRAIAKGRDVVVRKGGKLTNESSASGGFADLHVYSGGKVDITQGIAFKNVYMRGGFSWLDHQFDSLPRMKVAGDNITLGSGGKVYFDLCLNSTIYYMMALPADVALNTVTNEENTGEFKAWIKKYNGGARAGDYTDGSTPWISVTSGSLMRGVGYEVAIKKRNNRSYGILRFPLMSAWAAETECNPNVKAWGMDNSGNRKPGVTANNAGWNLVGNPFLTSFYNSEDSKIVNYGLKPHGDPWDGTYDWDTENVKFFSIPRRSYDDWYDVRAINTKLEPFFPFGLQVKTTGTLSFGPANRNLKPSILRKAIQQREVDVDFLLKDANGKTDNAGLTIGNDYSEAFDSEDMEKTVTGGTQYMKVYTIVESYRTAFNYLPEAAAAQPIPVGYIAPTAGTYTFTLLPSGDYSQVEKLLLTDYETSKTVDLLTEDYPFETEAGEINTRFVLNVILKAEGTTTDMDNVENNDVMNISVYGGDRHLVVRGLPTGASVWVYDAAGKLVATWNNVRDASLRTDVPAAGVYSVRAVLGGEGVTKRAIVK